MQPCKDNFATTFTSYPAMIHYHESMEQESVWKRCKVRDLHVEPLGLTSPLRNTPEKFAPNVSEGAIEDTAENLGLALRVDGLLYPVRGTAYKTLLDRAKITGTILPKLKREELANILNLCLSERNGTPLSHNTIGKHYNVLHTFFETAVDDEVIGCSPMQRMKKPKPKKDAVQTDEKALTLEESRRLLACLKDEPLMWRALIMFFLDSGCRRGEAVAMRWEDIDLKTGRIEVKGNAQYTVEKGKYITTPKSGKGRTVFLNEPVLAVLKEWKRKQAKWLLSMGLPHTGFVFTQDDGEMLNPNAPTKYLSKFGKRYGFPGLHPHTLRHPYVKHTTKKYFLQKQKSQTIKHTAMVWDSGFFNHLKEQILNRTGLGLCT